MIAGPEDPVARLMTLCLFMCQLPPAAEGHGSPSQRLLQRLWFCLQPPRTLREHRAISDLINAQASS
eukprot:6485407-Amphidinium_carterae.1